DIISGKILMLEPRRVAARAAAARLAELLGEEVGASVGYRMRGQSVPGRAIEVVTDGILVRMLQSDPELPGVGCVIFDEFHERALPADLGLALCLEVREALRGDLSLLVMSATLDAAPVAALMGDVPVITAEGRAYDVETRWLERPLGPGGLRGHRFSDAVADLVSRAAQEAPGDALVFLPGAGEIAQVAARLDTAALSGPDGLEARVLPLHGRLPFKEQRAALRPAQPGTRHIVLATSIAETSVTLPGVRLVVDGGRARRARHDPSSGMSRLVTEPVSRAEATQRQGRAGRVSAGICYRLWTKGEEGALAPFAPAEIEVADLVPLALQLAVWGCSEPITMRFLTPPNAGAFAAAQALLHDLGALDGAGRITGLGRKMAALPLHPRLARMMLTGASNASMLA
ncbi:MAG: helicase-related protein, partial [Pseudomonadota bacterium]